MKAEYKLEILPSARKELESLRNPVLKRVVISLHALADNPRPRGCRKLVGTDSDYRIRVGDYRVVYEVNDASRRIIIYRIKHRREAYE